MVIGQVISLHYLYCMLSLSRLTFKAYKDLTYFRVLLLYVHVVLVEAKPDQ